MNLFSSAQVLVNFLAAFDNHPHLDYTVRIIALDHEGNRAVRGSELVLTLQ